METDWNSQIKSMYKIIFWTDSNNNHIPTILIHTKLLRSYKINNSLSIQLDHLLKFYKEITLLLVIKRLISLLCLMKLLNYSRIILTIRILIFKTRKCAFWKINSKIFKFTITKIIITFMIHTCWRNQISQKQME
jgi:hypothetical protein